MAYRPAMTGALPDGTLWRVAMPKNWNGTLIAEPDIFGEHFDRALERLMLEHGYALVGVSRDVTNWDWRKGLDNNLAVLDMFEKGNGQPERTLLWGSSMGGLMTRIMMERFHGRFDQCYRRSHQ